MNDMSNAAPVMDEASRLALAAREALTDQMIERLAITAGSALEALDRLNDEATNTAIHRLIDRLTEMQKVGALDTACDMIMLLHAVRNALTDPIVERLVSYVENVVTNVGNEDVLQLAGHVCEAMNEAAEESVKTPARGGLMATISLLSKPKSQQDLQFLLNFAGALRGHLCNNR